MLKVFIYSQLVDKLLVVCHRGGDQAPEEEEADAGGERGERVAPPPASGSHKKHHGEHKESEHFLKIQIQTD